jgi:acyl-coenzyme A synthetase/AMP-(fatty) acid ligase
MFTTWTLGGELCVVPESELMMPAHFIRRMELAVWSSVPAIGNFMQKLGVLKEDAFPSLQITRFAGEPLSLRMAKVWQSAAPNSTVENHYGPTESTIDVARYVYQPSAAESLFSNGVVPIGHAFPGTDIKIVDENNQPVASEVQGQIIFKGPQVSKGYLNDDIKTQSAFVQFAWDTSHAIWYKSGDLGFINAHGLVECLGRMDSQIKFSGKRVEIGEIEAALSRFDALSDVVVVAVKDAQGVVSELVGFTASELSAQALASIKQSSRQWLDPLFFPKRILTLAQLPYAVSGKVDRRTLADMALKASKH